MPLQNPRSNFPLPHTPLRPCASAGSPLPGTTALPSAVRHPSSPLVRRAAFTLIELLVVIAIIGILAGLTLAAVGGIQKRGARAKAESEIQAISSAIEEYRLAFGSFPATNNLVAELTASTVPAASSGNLSNTGANRRVFLEANPGMVNTNSSPWQFMDPWGNNYIYSTNTAGFFEIYSTGGGTDSNQFIRN